MKSESEVCISNTGASVRRTLGARDSASFNVRLPRTSQTVSTLAAYTYRSALKSALLVCCFLTSVFCLPASAQDYSINWHTIDGGGGTSTGGVYSVSGTIGQPDASTTTMTGGNYTLTGGFWSLIAIQTPGSPTLRIVPAGSGQATISWTPDTPGFVLQQTISLSPVNWTNSFSGSTNPVTVPVSGDMKYFRLFKP